MRLDSQKRNKPPTGDLSQAVTLTGQPMTNLAEPWPLTFEDDAVTAKKYGGLLSLPKALRGEVPNLFVLQIFLVYS